MDRAGIVESPQGHAAAAGPSQRSPGAGA
jgi:hypothetical protein